MLLFLDSIPYIVIFIFGIVIGSFLNVCIYRLPLHESIITAPLPLYDLWEEAQMVRYGSCIQLDRTGWKMS